MDLKPDALFELLLADLNEQDKGFSEALAVGTVFNDSNSPRLAACLSLAKAFLKKREVANNEKLDAVALLKFLESDWTCQNWAPPCWDDVLYNEFKGLLYGFFTPGGMPFPGLLESLDRGSVGPGAALQAIGGDFYSKLASSPLTCSNQSLYTLYKHWVNHRPLFNGMESFRIEHFGPVSLVEGSRICFVPKNDTTSRSICVEPSLNMYFQLGFGDLITERLRSFFGINLADQQFKNRELSRRGSVFGCFATIDLSSASDTISLKMLEHSLPRNVYSTLCQMRSPKTFIDGIGWRTLDMVSSMGNGFTFPLETVIFTCAAVAAMRYAGVPIRYPRGSCTGNFGVFGDDIIVPTEAVEPLLNLLKKLGFSVNSEKSFWMGLFRESCGADYFKGVNIRGVYLKRLETIQDAFSLINQLNLFSARTGVKLRRTVQALMQRVPWTPVPRWENDDAGVKVPLGIFNTKCRRFDRNVGSMVYYAYRSEPLKVRIGESYIRVPKRLRRYKPIYNPDGLHLAFLRGTINASSYSVRHDRVRYKRKRSIAPYWDYCPDPHPYGWFPWQRWDTAAYINLFG